MCYEYAIQGNDTLCIKQIQKRIRKSRKIITHGQLKGVEHRKQIRGFDNS